MLTEVLEQTERETQSENLEAARTRIAASIACHAAIKINTRLDPQRMEWLLAELAKTEHPTSCPHGRPIALGILGRTSSGLFSGYQAKSGIALLTSQSVGRLPRDDRRIPPRHEMSFFDIRTTSGDPRTLWRQKAEPLITLDDAQSWLSANRPLPLSSAQGTDSCASSFVCRGLPG